jgi:hypothetical protein
MVPDSIDPDSEEVVPDSVLAMDSEVVPDSVVAMDSEVVHCPRCSTFHAGGVFGEECFQAHREARRCSHCGLLHEDYHTGARLFHVMDKFDCEIYIANVEKLEMRGNTIMLPDEVVKKLEEHLEKVQQTKISKVLLHASHNFTRRLLASDSATNLHLLICYRKTSK